MEGKPPAERLAAFDTLLWRCCRKVKRVGRQLDVTRKNGRDVRQLHRHFRDNFAHFTPKGWSIEKAGLPRIVGVAVDWTGRLMTEGDVSYKLNGNQKRRLAERLETIKTGLSKSV